MGRPANVLATCIVLLGGTVPTADGAESGNASPDLQRYRTNTPEARIQRVPADVRSGLSTDPQRYVGPLVESLLAGVDDPYLKTKVLHDWIADNIAYDVDSYLSGKISESSWEATLRNRQGVCHGYSQLLKKLCELADIPCEAISGYGRGFGFRPGDVEDLARTNHAWNAVYLGGRWHLVDVTWNAGHVRGSAYQKRYSTAYLFLAPRLFLHTHLPAESKWQLLNPARTGPQFAALPYLSGRFFEYRLRLLTGLQSVNRMKQSVQFSVEVPEDIQISTTLAAADGEKLPRRTLVQREGTRATILATFPSAGRWFVHLHAKARTDPGSYWRAASFVFDSSEGTSRMFAETYGKYHTLGASLQSPLYLPLAADRQNEFRIQVPGAEEVNLVVGKKWWKMSNGGGAKDVFRTTTPVALGARVLLTAKMPGDATHHTLVNFTTSHGP